MTTSVLTNVYYINISNGGSKNIVYRIDRNNTLSKVKIRAKLLGNMKVIPHEDRLIYEDKSNGKFHITNPDEEISLNSNRNLKLLGINNNDVIYIGELNGNKIVDVMYGKINDNPADWQHIVLESLVGIK